MSSIYEVLEPILANTYNPDRAFREKAEKDLNSFLALPNSFTGFLGILTVPTISNEVKMAAALTLKNNARAYWQLANPTYVMTEDEKSAAKSTILGLMVVITYNPLRALLAEIIKAIVEHEYQANRWPALVPTLVSYLQSSDQLAIFNSLIALRKLVKFFEYKKDEARRPLNDIIIATYPTLQALCSSLQAHTNMEVGMVFNQVFKIFWSCTMYRLPSQDTSVACDIQFWFQLMSSTLEKALPGPGEPDGQPANVDDRPAWPWWKAKKWAVRIILRFITRYGNPRFASEEDQVFATYFNTHMAPILLAPVMNTLAAVTRGEYVTEVVNRECLEFMSAAVETASTYKFIKEHLDFVMFSVIMPSLCLQTEDIALFSSDPIEFVRKVHDVMEEFRAVRVSAANLLETLVRKRGKDTLGRLLTWIQENLAVYDAEAVVSKRNHRVKDAIMVAIATIFPVLRKNKTYKHILIPFLAQHVVPEFTSQVPFLRSRSCWIIEHFGDMKWDSPECGDILNRIVPGLLSGLRDPALPVQAAAACSMRAIVSARAAKPLLKPILHVIVGEFFRIMNDVENEDMLDALSIIVENFREDIVPIAPTMISNLGEIFMRLSAQGADDDEAAFAAGQCLETMYAIVEVLDPENGGSIEQLRTVETMLMPIMQKAVATADCYEYLENGVQFMILFTYYGDTISPAMWSLCGPLLHSLSTWASDYIQEIMTPLLNFMSKDMSTFLSASHNGVPCVQQLLQIVDKTFAEPPTEGNEREMEAKCVASLLQCLLVTAKPYTQSMAGIWNAIFQMIMRRMTTDVRTPGLLTKLLECVLSMIYADVGQTLALFAHPANAAYTGEFFDKLFQRLPAMDKTETQRLVVLAFSTLITVPLESLPLVAQANINAIFVQVLREIALLQTTEDDVCLQEREGEEGDEDGDDYYDGGDFGDDDGDGDGDDMGAGGAADDGEIKDVEDVEDQTYHEHIAALGGGGTKYMHGEPVDDEDDDSYEFTSPLDNIDVLRFFVAAVQSNAAAYGAQFMSTLSGEDMQRVNVYVEQARQRHFS